MPFPGPAKEQRTTHHIIQVGNDEKKFQRKGKDSRTNERNFSFYLSNNCTDQNCARDIRIWIEKKAREKREKRKHRPVHRPETTWTDKGGRE
jgi:hypothetical protein